MSKSLCEEVCGWNIRCIIYTIYSIYILYLIYCTMICDRLVWLHACFNCRFQVFSSTRPIQYAGMINIMASAKLQKQIQEYKLKHDQYHLLSVDMGNLRNKWSDVTSLRISLYRYYFFLKMFHMILWTHSKLNIIMWFQHSHIRFQCFQTKVQWPR